MPKTPKRQNEPLDQPNGQCCAPTAESIEQKPVAAPRAKQVWEMTLEQFQQQYFPELCRSATSSAADASQQRNAA